MLYDAMRQRQQAYDSNVEVIQQRYKQIKFGLMDLDEVNPEAAKRLREWFNYHSKQLKGRNRDYSLARETKPIIYLFDLYDYYINRAMKGNIPEVLGLPDVN